MAILCAALLLLAAACGREPQVADPSGEGNASETIARGVILDEAGNPAPNTRVTAVSASYDPVRDGPVADSLADTTDENGEYIIGIPDSGFCNIEAVSLTNGTRALIPDISLADDTVLVPDATLRGPGTLRVPLPLSADTVNGYVYLAGTEIAARIAGGVVENGYLLLDSVPAGTSPAVRYAVEGAADTAMTLADGVEVLPGLSVTIDPFNGGTGLFIGVMDTGTFYSLIDTYRRYIDYRFVNLTLDVHTGWYVWQPNGAWGTDYIARNEAIGLKTAFVYEQLYAVDYITMQGIFNNSGAMLCEYEDIERLCAVAAGREVLLILEPFLLAYAAPRWYADSIQSLAEIPVHVTSSLYPTVAGYDNTFPGFWQAMVSLPERFAPDAKVGLFFDATAFPVGTDPGGPAFWTAAEIDSTARLWKRMVDELGIEGKFDFISIGKDSIDAGAPPGGADWGAAQMQNFCSFAAALNREFGLPVVGWYLPIGHAGLPNEPNRYEDSFAQYFFENADRFREAGFAGMLFGKYNELGTDLSGAPGTGDDGWFLGRLESWRLE